MIFELWMTRLGLIGAIATAIAALLGHLGKKTSTYASRPTSRVERTIQEHGWNCTVTNHDAGWSLECR